MQGALRRSASWVPRMLRVRSASNVTLIPFSSDIIPLPRPVGERAVMTKLNVRDLGLDAAPVRVSNKSFGEMHDNFWVVDNITNASENMHKCLAVFSKEYSNFRAS